MIELVLWQYLCLVDIMSTSSHTNVGTWRLIVTIYLGTNPKMSTNSARDNLVVLVTYLQNTVWQT